MTERDAQILVWRWNICHSTNFLCILPNSGILGHEADVVKVMPSGRTTEFEIKCSLADLRADAKKVEKFSDMNRLALGETHGPSRAIIPGMVYPYPVSTRPLRGPNYFFYVIEHEWIAKVAIPDWAGILVYSTDHTRVVLHQPATLLHKGKIGTKEHLKLLRSMSWKLWNTRIESENRKGGDSIG